MLILFLIFIFFSSYEAVDFIPPSPTGSHPRFMAQLPQLKNDYAKFYADAKKGIQPAATWLGYLQNHAVSDAKPAGSAWLTYHAITMYQITGDNMYASIAWNMTLNEFINKYPNYDYSCCKFSNSTHQCCPDSSSDFYDGDNNARIIAGYWVDTYDWIYNFLTADQRAQFRAKLQNFFDYLFRGNGYCCSYSVYSSWPIRSTDTDVILHNYFSFVKYYAATGDESQHAYSLFSNPEYNFGGVLPKSISPFPNGRCQSGCYNTTDLGINIRTNVNALIIKFAAGGTGMYSTGYNLEGVMSKVAYDWAGLRTAFGQDYFPEIGCYLLSFAEHYMSLVTPNKEWMYRWGDEEAGTNSEGMLYIDLSVISATTKWFFDDPRQAQINDFMNTLYNLWGGTNNTAVPNNKKWNPYHEFFYAFQYPATTTKTDFTQLIASPGGRFSWDILGIGTWRSGWNTSDSLFGFEYCPWHFLDHFTQYGGNFQLYRKGEWSFYTPLSYGRPSSSGEVTNTMSYYGFPDGPNFVNIREFKGILDVTFGTDYAFFIGATAGNHRDNATYAAPQTFQQEATRSVLYIHGTKSEHILIVDRSNIIDLKQTPGWNASGTWWARSDAQETTAGFWTKPRKAFQWHLHQSPSTVDNSGGILSWKPAHLTGDDWNGYNWVTSTTQSIRLKTHWTTGTTFSYVAENTMAPNLAKEWYWDDLAASGYLATETYNQDQPFDTTLHVGTVYDNGATFTTTEFTSSNNIAKGVVITRPPDNDVIAFYNVQQGPSIPSPKCGGTSIGCCPCYWNKSVATIVPTQHYFKSGDTYTFTNIPISTSAITIYLNDLNPSYGSYVLVIDNIRTVQINSLTVGGFIQINLPGPFTLGTHNFCVEVLNSAGCSSASGSPSVQISAPPMTSQPNPECPYEFIPTPAPPLNPTPAPLAPTPPPPTPTPKGGEKPSLNQAHSTFVNPLFTYWILLVSILSFLYFV